MNKQNNLNASDLQSLSQSGQLFYIEIKSGFTEEPVETRAVPLNVIVNSTHDRFLVPVVNERSQEDQVCVYVEPTVEDNSLVHIINNHKLQTAVENTIIDNDNEHPKPSCSKLITSQNLPNLPVKPIDLVVSNNLNSQAFTSGLNTENNKTKEEINKIKGFVPIVDREIPSRAIAVLPPVLHMRRGCITPRRSLPQRVRFGPVEGVTSTISFSAAYGIGLNAAKSKTPVFLLNVGDGVLHIDVSDKDKSNWFSLLPLGTKYTANVWLYQEDKKLYGITVESIDPGTPLALGYSKPYVQDYGLPEGQPTLHITQDLLEEPLRWWCYECQRSFVTSAQLQRHSDQFHPDGTNGRRKYRCQHCTRTFMRLYTLKRHMSVHKKLEPEKLDNSNKTPDDGLNTSLNLEDNRIPSDESLQNYTNMLDFSTNLFDTDRMPGLDISGSSRSDTDFNPYGISYRDDLSHDLGFDKITSELEKTPSASNEVKKETQSSSESMLISCQYCKQTIIREKKREHLSICTEKQFDCECGRKFTNNEKYTQHVHAEHSSTSKIQDDKTMGFEESESLEYKCDKCHHLFKRRGMLVNHLWSKHRSRAPVPLERRVRHYPCAACPKLYRTAAKRDVHHKAHHPGVAQGRYSIDSGRRSVAPASCSACPRQYATRAKLLQHQRQCHPHLAPPPMKPKRKQP